MRQILPIRTSADRIHRWVKCEIANKFRLDVGGGYLIGVRNNESCGKHRLIDRIRQFVGVAEINPVNGLRLNIVFEE